MTDLRTRRLRVRWTGDDTSLQLRHEDSGMLVGWVRRQVSLGGRESVLYALDGSTVRRASSVRLAKASLVLLLASECGRCGKELVVLGERRFDDWGDLEVPQAQPGKRRKRK